MEISIFGILLILYSVKLLIVPGTFSGQISIRYTELCIVLCIFLDAGFVFKIGGFECEYNYFLTILAFVAISVSSRSIVIGKQALTYITLIVYLIAVVALHALVGTEFHSSSYLIEGGWEGAFKNGSLVTFRNHISQIIKPLIRMIVLGCILISYSKKANDESVNKINSIVFKLSITYLFILGIEFIIINFTGTNYREVMLSLFGHSSSTSPSYRTILGFNIPLGFTREPASLAFQCLMIFTSNLYYVKKNGKGKAITIIYIIVLMLSLSMSSIMYMLAAGYLIYKPFKGNNKVIITFAIPIIAILGGMVAYSLFSGRFILLQNDIFKFREGLDAITLDSTIIRTYSIYNNIQYFLKYPFIGTGLYSIYSFSAVVTLITNFGIIGSYLYIKFYKKCLCNISEGKIIGIKLLVFVLLCFLFTGSPGQILYYPQMFYFFVIANNVLENDKVTRIEAINKWNITVVSSGTLSST